MPASELPPVPDAIVEAPLSDALSQRYLAYALSTIMARSLPDVRDGLKPVHRRLLFAMNELRLEPNTPPKKSARVVGDVIGKFHPHGDQSVYDALVRLAQDFLVRFPLIDGQGNFGNIDGDNAAAMRYTEARLTLLAKALLDGIDEDTVDFSTSYDGETREPELLPAAVPHLLANGATGIAVGMATSIPPHNLGELLDACRHLLAHPQAGLDEILRLIPGPDFATGGILVEAPDTIAEAYRTGRGSFRVRAAWVKEDLAQGQYRLVVTEMPPTVQKSRLIEKIADLLANKKLPLLEDVQDESAEDIRLVLTPKSRNVDPAVLMESLFRISDLEVRFSLNMNVLDAERVPRVMTLVEVLQAFLDHARVVLQRRSAFRLGKIRDRLEVLGGYLIAYLNLDEVIRIIREEDRPKEVLMAAFGLTDNQAEAILNMRLRSLRKLEEMEIRGEHDRLSTEGAGIEALLASTALQDKALQEQLAERQKQFGKTAPGGARRTVIAGAPVETAIAETAFMEREPITVVCSAMGWIRALKGHIADADLGAVKFKEGDSLAFVLRAETVDKLLVFASNGRFYTLGADKLPGGRGFGEPVRLMVDLPNDVTIVTMLRYRPGQMLALASSDGRGFRVAEDDVLAQTRAGKNVLTVGEGVRAAACVPCTGDRLALIGNNRKLLILALDDVPVMTKGRGVTLIKLKDAQLSDMRCLDSATGLSWSAGERTRTVGDISPWLGTRASVGKLPPNGFPRDNRFG